MSKPLCIDLFCGLGGWAEGFLAEDYDVIGFDIERRPYPGQLVLQDVRTLHGSQFRNAAVIVASPPCQEYSYMAMPWKRAKQRVWEYSNGTRHTDELTHLFDTCFRIQREACEAAGRYIPMVVENVRGANPWVGQAKWHYGSYYLWGDVPALMPVRIDGYKSHGMNWSDRTLRGQDFTRIAGLQNGIKLASESGRSPAPGNGVRFTSRDCGIEGVKQPGISGTRNNGKGNRWFQDGAATHGSKSSARKQASALIAKIPFPLAQHIARTYKPMAVIQAEATRQADAEPSQLFKE